MRKRLGTSIAIAAAALLLLSPVASSASTEVGWDCVANDSEANWTLLASGSSGIPLPPVVTQEGASVITSWRVRVGPGLGPLAQRLEVFQVVNEKEEYVKRAESAVETVVPGTNSFPTRIPVTEGNSIGLYGPNETLFCAKEAGAVSVLYQGSVGIGETRVFKAAVETGAPVTAVVEPDRDADGYGDETQDACPQSAALQTPCPAVVLDAFPIVLKRSILVLVGASSAAPVTVTGKVGPTLRNDVQSSKARHPGELAKRTANFGGGTQALVPGQIGRFNVRLPKSLRRRLSHMSRHESLRASLTASATNAAGQTTTKFVTVKLPGQKRG
ncbi:MAG TPA: hypothetical protein VHQ43_09760 [Solirubrobacterales bacterium]|jgi:hypothetical protein|nr:hypothetical protein [Solirubrobacterales bacterium]